MHVQQQLKNLTNITVKDVGYVLKSIMAHYKQFTFTKELRLIIKIKYQQSQKTLLKASYSLNVYSHSLTWHS